MIPISIICLRMAMELEDYNKSFEHVIETAEEEADNRLRLFRQQCVRDFIENLNRRQNEWETTFHELLKKSQEESNAADKLITPALSSNDSLFLKSNLLGGLSFTNATIPQRSPEIPIIDQTKENKVPSKNEFAAKPLAAQENKSSINVYDQQTPITQSTKPQSEQSTPSTKGDEDVFNDPLFSNISSVQEFIRVQTLLEQNRNSFASLSSDAALKGFKNELTLFIRTQINSISNSDSKHLETKIRQLTNLFIGQIVRFQDRAVDASRHPQGQLFSMDLAAQTFVTVGTRLVNSVPAIAKSMAVVITGIVNNNLPVFKDLVTGHLQERCPYLIPMHPKIEDFSSAKDREIKHKVACGYSYDLKAQTLESDEKYLSRMRSMVLIYACILIQGHMDQAWTWLASFLSLKPQPVISATVLQAFLQEASKKMSSTYGVQYKKLLAFIKSHYVKMVEDATPKASDRQSLIKLKNLLSDDSNLIATPSMGSIFGAVRLA